MSNYGLKVNGYRLKFYDNFLLKSNKNAYFCGILYNTYKVKSTNKHSVHIFNQYNSIVVTFIVMPYTTPRRRPGC